MRLGDRVWIVPLGEEAVCVRVLGVVALVAGWWVIRGYQLRPDDIAVVGPLTVWTLHDRHVLAVLPEHWPQHG